MKKKLFLTFFLKKREKREKVIWFWLREGETVIMVESVGALLIGLLKLT